MSDSGGNKVLELLCIATSNGLMTWSHTGEDRFSSALGQDQFEIEIIHLQRSQEDLGERAMARISGRDIYQTYAIGTHGYKQIMEILRLCIHGWQEGSEGADRKLKNLQDRLANEIAEQGVVGNGDRPV